MSLLKQIKSSQLEARKLKKTFHASLLTTLIGESEIVGKNDGNRETTDQEVIAVVKKFIKNIDETLKVLQQGTPEHAIAVLEKNVLMEYLPRQLDETQLLEVIKAAASSLGTNEKGPVMKFLKENHGGMYDGKLASELIGKL